MRIAVTGADGFLGWHVRSALRAIGEHEVVPVGRVHLDESPDNLARRLEGADAVLHLAGVNRADPDELRNTNLQLATRLTAALDLSGAAPVVVYANSIQAGNGTPYGDGKEAAAAHLTSWGRSRGSVVADLMLPNIFGEHGKPSYNSFVATFCDALARGERPTVVEDREIPLRHVQDVADDLIAAMSTGVGESRVVAGRGFTVSEVLARLVRFRDLYRTGEIPDLRDPFDLSLFNTYRSYCFPAHYPIQPPVMSDPRGDLFECLRLHGGQAQVFCSSTNPGHTRGNHFHRRKVERFQVLRGQAVIALRRLFTDDVVEFPVSGEVPSIVDMPTMWVHNIRNVGDDELVTLFWTADLLDRANPDTYPESV